jgi:hypothetical protein
MQIINSLAANRPASELAALAAGIRPPPPPELLTPSLSASSAPLSLSSSPLSSSHSASTYITSPSRREDDPSGPSVAAQVEEDDNAPLPADAVPPTPGFGPRSRGGGRQRGPAVNVGEGGAGMMDLDGGGEGYFLDVGGVALSAGLNGSSSDIGGGKGKRREESEMLLAHRTVFFFKLEREIEKVRLLPLSVSSSHRSDSLTVPSFRTLVLPDQRLLSPEGARPPASAPHPALESQTNHSSHLSLLERRWHGRS